jgi:hypothetical protein
VCRRGPDDEVEPGTGGQGRRGPTSKLRLRRRRAGPATASRCGAGSPTRPRTRCSSAGPTTGTPYACRWKSTCWSGPRHGCSRPCSRLMSSCVTPARSSPPAPNPTSTPCPPRSAPPSDRYTCSTSSTSTAVRPATAVPPCRRAAAPPCRRRRAQKGRILSRTCAYGGEGSAAGIAVMM